jgi:aspartate/tyrosine/aromatic aminotransferase
MADIYVQEDKHDPAIEQTEEYEWDARNTVLNLRTGSYKKKDAYSMQYFKAGRIGPQAVVLYPDRKHKIAFHGEEAIRDSIVYLNGIK